MQYAIVDIETTGGSARGSRMTEIAIRVMDGVEVVESWQSLINPKQPIPPAIFALTGITDEMVEHAPEFAEIADQVFRLLDGKIFVAHHVNFDYSFVKHQLEECGIRWSAPKLCTVRLARKIYPGLASYSLGRLCDYLGIPILHRHRAGGDADATAILFAKLLQADQGDVVKEMVKKSNPQQRLPAHLNVEEFENLPNSPGVYYFHNQAGKVIYVGKAVKLKSRVGTHFTGHPTHLRRQQFLKEIHHISYEICATELMALLLECIEIKRLWPAHNRALKRFEAAYGLYHYEGIDGFMHLGVGRLQKNHTCVQTYSREFDAIKSLHQLREEFQLDPKYCHVGGAHPDAPRQKRPKISDFQGAEALDKDAHNDRVCEAITSLNTQQPSFFIIDKGRPGQDEKSCIYVERGNFYGMGYLPDDVPMSDWEEIRSRLTRYPGNHYMMQLILQFAQRYPHKLHRIS